MTRDMLLLTIGSGEQHALFGHRDRDRRGAQHAAQLAANGVRQFEIHRLVWRAVGIDRVPCFLQVRGYHRGWTVGKPRDHLGINDQDGGVTLLEVSEQGDDVIRDRSVAVVRHHDQVALGVESSDSLQHLPAAIGGHAVR